MLGLEDDLAVRLVNLLTSNVPLRDPIHYSKLKINKNDFSDYCVDKMVSILLLSIKYKYVSPKTYLF